MKVLLLLAAVLILMVPSAGFAFAPQSRETAAKVVSDRDKAGLRGPVKKCVEERIYPDESSARLRGTFAIITAYTPDGRIRQEHPDNSHYQHDEQGRKIKIQTFSTPRGVAELLWEDPPAPSGSAAEPWKRFSFPRLPSGTFTTIYNEQGVASEGQLRDAQGQLVARILRTFDASGKLTLEKEIIDKPEVILSDEEMMGTMSAPASEAHKRVFAVWMVSVMGYSSQVSYSYDSEGRLVEKRQRKGGFEWLTTITYNERGDEAAEREETTEDTSVPRGIQFNADGAVTPYEPDPIPPLYREAQHTYQYDSYGNWTERTTVARFSKDAPLKLTTIVHRKLTYY